MEHFRQFTFKQFGYLDFDSDLPQRIQRQNLSEFILIVYLKAGGSAIVDFEHYQLQTDTLFFINAGQYHEFLEDCKGTAIYYNRDFYCVEIHDAEVACDGVLFHNAYEITKVDLGPENAAEILRIMSAIKTEFEREESSMEEMLRILLKQIIIYSTRLWKKEHSVDNEQARHDFEFLRKFSQLVEWNYTKLHSVSEYAGLLSITPKALGKRISRFSIASPNDIIKARVILEAKRLLAHTPLSVKEIGYKLGYDDTSYFIRLFTSHAKTTPQQFRLRYQQGA